MNLHCISSSSKGSGYVLSSDNECLVLECGTPLIEVKKVIDFDISRISGVTLSHSHGDHARYINQYIDAGLDVFSSKETFLELGVSSHRAHAIETEETVQIGLWKVMAFDVIHDTDRPYGFLIHSEQTGNVLFATDTSYLQNTFDNLNNLIVECNYSDEILESNIASGRLHGSMKNRVYNNHMSSSVLIDMLKANDLTHVANIVLIHLSNSNSSASEFRQAVIDATGKNVIIADKDMTINFNISPF